MNMILDSDQRLVRLAFRWREITVAGYSGGSLVTLSDIWPRFLIKNLAAGFFPRVSQESIQGLLGLMDCVGLLEARRGVGSPLMRILFRRLS
ncbi:MAG TPA: hypothetical protein VGL71_14320, partial [Urbifossiella sp.]